MKITRSILSEINNAVPDYPPETGGILGSHDGRLIDELVMDIPIETTDRPCSYYPNTDFLNKNIQIWQEHDVSFMGIFHTHFVGVKTLSHGDKKYINTIMAAMPDTIEYLYGCINKSGKMIFKKDATNILEVSEFKKGYAHIKYKNAYAVIDKQGNELSRYVIGTNTTVRAYGEGYILVQEYKAGFDFSGYTYTIYDGLGKVITTWNNKKEIGGNIKYMGEGVFSFYAQDQGYYCCKSNKWVDYEGKLQQYFNDEYVIIDTGRSRMTLMDSLGNIKEVTTSGDIVGDYSWYSAVGDGVCVLYRYSNKDCLIAYGIKDNSFKTMSDYYANRADWDKYLDDSCFNSFIGERMLVPLIGDDGVEYVVLFDKNWNAVAEPVRANGYLFSGDRLIAYQSHYSASSLSIVVDDITVYDENCNRLFDMSDIGFSGYQMNGYSDGVAKIVKSGTTKYIDKNGELLFSEIDMSTAMLK